MATLKLHESSDNTLANFFLHINNFHVLHTLLYKIDMKAKSQFMHCCLRHHFEMFYKAVDNMLATIFELSHKYLDHQFHFEILYSIYCHANF